VSATIFGSHDSEMAEDPKPAYWCVLLRMGVPTRAISRDEIGFLGVSNVTR
jgi:hypothetical protein